MVLQCFQTMPVILSQIGKSQPQLARLYVTLNCKSLQSEGQSYSSLVILLIYHQDRESFRGLPQLPTLLTTAWTKLLQGLVGTVYKLSRDSRENFLMSEGLVSCRFGGLVVGGIENNA